MSMEAAEIKAGGIFNPSFENLFWLEKLSLRRKF
jgi:hypothetical protein